WQRAYVVDRVGRVWMTTDAGATPFVDVTGNLGALSSDVRSVEVVPGTSAPGDETVILGGAGGVFRSLGTPSGGSTQWALFGANIPNTLVTDLDYDATDDVLVAGTLGRGAWTMPNASTA